MARKEKMLTIQGPDDAPLDEIEMLSALAELSRRVEADDELDAGAELSGGTIELGPHSCLMIEGPVGPLMQRWMDDIGLVCVES